MERIPKTASASSQPQYPQGSVSPLSDRRIMILMLKTQGGGRRSFSESCRYTKITNPIRIKRYEVPTKQSI
jgi:hypothetical protein